MTTIEESLAEAAADPRAAAWGVLYERACQDGFGEADEALLVARLVAIAAGFTPADRDEALILAGRLAADMDEQSHRRHAETLARLRRLAVDWLATPTDARTFVYRLRAILALEGDMLWGEELERLIFDEVEIECPQCDTSLFIVFGEQGHFATHEDYATKADVPRTPLLPATSGDLDGVGRRLHDMSTGAGQQSVADAVAHVFGRATCTRCDSTFRVADQIERV